MMSHHIRSHSGHNPSIFRSNESHLGSSFHQDGLATARYERTRSFEAFVLWVYCDDGKPVAESISLSSMTGLE